MIEHQDPITAEPAAAPGETDVLIVDDTPEVCALLRSMLHQRGFSVAIAGDAKQGLAQIQRLAPRVVLMDLMMPGIDGAALLKVVRSDWSAGALPIIVLTSSKRRTDLLKCLEAGANDFMQKPVDFDVLAARIAVQIAISDRVRELEQAAQPERSAALCR